MGAQEPPSGPRGNRRWVPYSVLLLSLAATAGVAAFVRATAERQDRARFDRASERTRVAVANRMDAYAASLRNITALFQTGGVPNREQFGEYVGRLDLPGHYPGLQGIGFSVRFAAAERQTWADAGVKTIDPSFRLWPEEPPRDEYHAILYLEPLDERNRRAIGFDMHSDPARAAAMDAARDAARPTASGKVRLIQETEDTPNQAGFLIYMPLYRGKHVPRSLEERREKLYGYVYAPFRADDLFAGIFRGDANAGIDFVLHDGAAAEPSSLLHDSSRLRPSGGVAGARPRFSKLDRIEVAGRPWTIRFVTRPEFEHSSHRWLAPLILGLGGLVSLTLFAITRSQVTALIAERRATDGLRRSEAELRQAKAAAEAANRTKDEFLATLSHELRTPLNAILGWCHLLRTGAITGEEVAQGLDVIDRNARAQTRLIEDLLDMSRIVSGKLRLEFHAVDLPTVVASAVESVRPAAEAKGVRLETTLDVDSASASARVRGDAARLQQVVSNLLTNAIKFTPEGGDVRVSLIHVDSRVELAVSDTGVGIEPEFLPHVFERFRQADASSTRQHGGLGLGLGIVKHLVELHGGTVRAESAGEGRGSTFVVSLPVEQGHSQDNGDGRRYNRADEATHAIDHNFGGRPVAACRHDVGPGHRGSLGRG